MYCHSYYSQSWKKVDTRKKRASVKFDGDRSKKPVHYNRIDFDDPDNTSPEHAASIQVQGAIHMGRPQDGKSWCAAATIGSVRHNNQAVLVVITGELHRAGHLDTSAGSNAQQHRFDVERIESAVIGEDRAVEILFNAVSLTWRDRNRNDLQADRRHRSPFHYFTSRRATDHDRDFAAIACGGFLPVALPCGEIRSVGTALDLLEQISLGGVLGVSSDLRTQALEDACQRDDREVYSLSPPEDPDTWGHVALAVHLAKLHRCS